MGKLASDYSREVAAWNADDENFDKDFMERQKAAMDVALSKPDHQCPRDMQRPPSRPEVAESIKSLGSKLSKAPGPDGVMNWMLHWGGPSVEHALHVLSVRAWKGHLPKQWEQARVAYIYKGKTAGSAAEISAYRPISLISVIAKTFTRALLPRLAAQVGAHLVLQQGCGRKGQSCEEQLWAFKATMEDCIEGRDEDDEADGAFALFADVQKAYDQVWRSGLYLSLYSMGVRGNMWRVIQGWLDNSRVTTTWRGVSGPEVRLEQGLRQGCVLSPILYCCFINMLVAEGPAVEVPAQMRPAMDEFFSQGLQGMEGRQGCGVKILALPKRITSFLYMDDTTLIAKTKAGLERLTGAYLRFCRNFRMKVNARKSMVMHFSKTPPTEAEWEIRVGDATFKSPRGGVCKFLGGYMDHTIYGVQGDKRSGEARGMRHRVRNVARKFGEQHAVEFIATTLAPELLYAAEQEPTKMEGQMRKAWEDLLAEAARGGGMEDAKTYWKERNEVWLRKRGLMLETSETPWDLQIQQRQLRLHCTLLGAGKDSIAGAIMRGKAGNERDKKNKNRFLEKARVTAKGWNVKARALLMPGEKRVWKTDLVCQKERLVKQQMAFTNGDIDEEEGDAMLLLSRSTGRAETRKRASLFKGMPLTRVRLTRQLCGHMPGLRAGIVKRLKAIHKCPAEAIATARLCACNRGDQTVPHMMLYCARTDTVRETALKTAADVVGQYGTGAAKGLWGGMSDKERFVHLIGTRIRMGESLERRLRKKTAPGIVEGMQEAVRLAAEENVASGVEDFVKRGAEYVAWLGN